jgi:hypothetical protein
MAMRMPGSHGVKELKEIDPMSKWWWKADFIESCNCAHGCPCNFTGIPTDGTCKAVGTYWVREGAYDGTRIDGLGVAWMLYWPNPIHLGNGRCTIFIDERANEKQREALSEIVSGKAGPGGPFEIFAPTFSEAPSVRFGRFRFEREGKRGLVELNEAARVQIGPVLTAMDQSEADAHLVLPSGFIFRDARIVNTDKCEVMLPDLQFQYTDSSAFFSEVEYNV